MSKLRVGVLFGGRSGEHEVSLLSAASVMKAMDRSKYEVIPIGITKEGRWVASGNAERLLKGEIPEKRTERPLRAGDPEATSSAAVLHKGESVIVPPVPGLDVASLMPFERDASGPESGSTPAPKSDSKSGSKPASDSNSHHPTPIAVDVIFPVLHGTYGEDGTVQGLLELADIPYVGAGVLGSAAGMDKEMMKRLFAQAGLPIVKHRTILRSTWRKDPKKTIRQVESGLTYPLFVKPANLGSSVGISKAHDRSELGPAIEMAAGYDRKIVIEQGVGGKKQKARELECSVLGNDEPEASIAGEIVPSAEFYDYKAKYLDEGSQLLIPAPVPKAKMTELKRLAIAAFQAVDCCGLARVDFLMDPRSGKIYVNEINTMPGFTSISMYPKLWTASGLEYSKLIDRLIELALERHDAKRQTRYSRD